MRCLIQLLQYHDYPNEDGTRSIDYYSKAEDIVPAWSKTDTVTPNTRQIQDSYKHLSQVAIATIASCITKL